MGAALLFGQQVGLEAVYYGGAGKNNGLKQVLGAPDCSNPAQVGAECAAAVVDGVALGAGGAVGVEESAAARGVALPGSCDECVQSFCSFRGGVCLVIGEADEDSMGLRVGGGERFGNGGQLFLAEALAPGTFLEGFSKGCAEAVEIRSGPLLFVQALEGFQQEAEVDGC